MTKQFIRFYGTKSVLMNHIIITFAIT